MEQRSLFISEEIFNEEFLQDKNVYIFYSSINANKIFILLLQQKIKVSGFVAEKKQKIEKLYGRSIFLPEELNEDSAVYVVAQEEWNIFCNISKAKEVYSVEPKYLNRNDFIFYENGRIRKCNAALMLTMILSRIQDKQAIFLINSEYYSFWENVINSLKEETQDIFIIQVDTESEKIYDLLYYNVEKLIIFVTIFEHKEIDSILRDFGLKQTQNIVYIYNSFSGHITDKYCGFDWFLGNTFVKEQQMPGYYIYGDNGDLQKKIVLLGNSATDPLFYPQKSWPEMLWEQCKQYKKNIIIYNGAITDYNSSNEVIKMLRDVLLIAPDIVVSYGGFIDFRQYVPNYPYLNLNLMRTSRQWEDKSGKEVIYGIKDTRSAYERWLDNEKIMHQICEMHGISFYGVLQPWIGSECDNACEKLLIWSSHYWQVAFPQFEALVDNAKEFKQKIQSDVRENKWLYDFTDIFSGIADSEIYFDSIHVNERGNAIVAECFAKILNLFEKEN